MKVLMSIKPEFVEEIIKGTKKYEYRKSLFKNPDISEIVVYATQPFGKIVGEFEIEDILEDNPANIWSNTKKYSGISKSFFNQYFKDRKKGYAIKIKEFHVYDIPMDISEYDSTIKQAPQSFRYIS
ncbi:ASCH domain-containing protein [Marinilactibacillus psychrotolerans]|uniref:ASCH domain-containing protein n=2 Tax=Marinilactibacillus psychrotolerans TaxID=191770 RepID=A0A5R9BYE6_9LACT|nr:ASCH domain-containing protein [Marinilactibacillus psychrotolerans]TLQ05060.1 ASCH domain-containing protein [Marinilactibacillus psychrotolerans]GEQ34459.1 hypothetical protein B795N_23410 [Marinilactibacillus psychrotolerans]SJN43314.1 Phage protein [Marinilactibacillus psychrotolerans 42ea]